jgi:hypothetical protein
MVSCQVRRAIMNVQMDAGARDHTTVRSSPKLTARPSVIRADASALILVNAATCFALVDALGPNRVTAW